MSAPRQITIQNVSQTHALAREMAENAQNGDIFTLQGPLGAGKSEFARAFIQHLMGDDIDVPSPTFTLLQSYDSAKGTIWHFDLYRLESPEEIYEIGWEEAMSDGISLIEWPQRLGHLMPHGTTEIIITPQDKESRMITIQNHNGSLS